MRLNRSPALPIAILLGIAAAAPQLSAQSATTGAVSGTTVSRSTGAPIPGALVTLTPLGAGAERETSTTNAGAFSLAQVTPGSYEIRIEAVGFLPLVARTLTIGSGERQALDLVLTPATPPIVTVDSVTLGGGPSTRVRDGGVTFGRGDVEALPNRLDDLASIASLSPGFDDAFGAQGLPGDLTLLVADGLPFYRAPHPTAHEELVPDALFPRSAISSVIAFYDPSDIEWSAGSGSVLAVSTRSSTSERGIEAEAAYSGDPLWTSSRIDGPTPSLLSWQGGLRGTVSLEPGVSQLVLSGEALEQQTPLAARASTAVIDDLAGLDPETLDPLGAPSVETYSRYSGLARLDVQRSESSRFFLRAAGSVSSRDFDGPGPPSLANHAAPSEESIEFSTAAAYVTASSRSLTLEFRAGVSGSYRDFGPGPEGVPPAYLSGLPAFLGTASSEFGSSGRTDIWLTPAAIYSNTNGTLRIGGSVRASRHTVEHSWSSLGEFVFDDPPAAVSGTGFWTRSDAPEVSFSTRELGLFAQYDIYASPDFRISFGGRYDFENVPLDELEPNAIWASASGIQNEDVRNGFQQLGVRGAATWEPRAGHGTRVFLTSSLSEGDVDSRALYQLFSQDRTGRVVRFQGPDLEWPSGAVSASAIPTLTLFGPDMRAPRTRAVGLGVTEPVAGGVAVFARGSLRRTDFLIRRRNLNIALNPGGVDPYGRAVYGTLSKTGSVVATTSDDARRFAEFGPAWALDPDGWSEYRGLTLGLEAGSDALDLYGAYTYSETTDNWIGARSGLIDAMLPPLLPDDSESESAWDEGVSDFDAPHRVVAGLTVTLPRVVLSGTYHFRSGLPFTPGYRTGVDANGDGSMRNDVAFVPAEAELASVLVDWPCLEGQTGGFAVRNSCRGPAHHSADARARIDLGSIAGRRASFVIDAFNLIESEDGVVDDALLLVDPDTDITSNGTTVSIPVTVNSEFGRIVYPTSRGTMFRIGLKVGG